MCVDLCLFLRLAAEVQRDDQLVVGLKGRPVSLACFQGRQQQQESRKSVAVMELDARLVSISGCWLDAGLAYPAFC